MWADCEYEVCGGAMLQWQQLLWDGGGFLWGGELVSGEVGLVFLS